MHYNMHQTDSLVSHAAVCYRMQVCTEKLFKIKLSKLQNLVLALVHQVVKLIIVQTLSLKCHNFPCIPFLSYTCTALRAIRCAYNLAY